MADTSNGSLWVEEVLKRFEVEIFDVIGDEFAPKQEGGSSERQRLLGLLIKIVPAFEEAKSAILKHEDEAIIAYRDKITTDGRPLKAKPLIVEQPVPCTGCKAKEYADWTLLPHQVYNSIIPGGVGHYCFPCFAELARHTGNLSKEGN